MTTLLVVLVVTLGLVYYSDASICCFPSTYQANQRLVRATVSGGHLSVITGTIWYAKDGVSKQETFIEKLNVNGVDTNVTVIKDYNVTMAKYVISNGHCTKKSLDNWKDGCVPDWARHLEMSYFDEKPAGFSANVYDNSFPGSSIKSFLTVSRQCYPMFSVTVIPSGASQSMESVQFSNFTLGIKDRSVFDIPAICKGAHLVG